MQIVLSALQSEIPAIAGMEVQELCECLAMLGFPVESMAGSGNELVMEVDVTANRGDVLSHRGLARELSAKLDLPLSPILPPQIPVGDALLLLQLESSACPLYATAILALDCSRPSQMPTEAINFLTSIGSGAKGLAPVDASNELLHRFGHPTHAFDADKISGGVRVRWARAGESFLALDGIERKLFAEDLVIADESGPIALAGVLGGESTKVTENTKRVLLESAYFEPRAVRAAAHRHGIHTDASARFGRGADVAFVETARDLLASRLISWSGAVLLSSWTVGKGGHEPAEALLTKSLLERVAGRSVQLDEAEAVLRRLGCRVASSEAGLCIQPPTWRHDLSIQEDYAEEVLRIAGYDSIGSSLPPFEWVPLPMPRPYLQRSALSRRMAQLGFFQAVTFGFVGPKADAWSSGALPSATDLNVTSGKTDGRTLINPLGLEYSIMRGSLLPSLWSAAEANIRHGARDVRLFEIAPIFKSEPDFPSETGVLAMVWAGHIGGEDPLTPCRPVMAADVIAIARDIGCQAGIDAIELGQNAYGLEIELSQLASPSECSVPAYRHFSRFPVVARDLSLLVPLGLCYGKLEECIESVLEFSPVQSIRCVDVYKDAKLTAEGKQAWLIRLRFQSPDRTLTGDEVESWINMAIDAAASLGGTLRG